MSQVHAPDTQDTKKALSMAEQNTRKGFETDYAKTFAIAMLVKGLIVAIMRGGQALLGRDRNQDRKDSLLDNASDLLDGGRKKRVGRNPVQRLGNKTRGLFRNKKLTKAARVGQRANKAVKTAKFAKTATNISRVSKIAQNAPKLAKTAKFAKTASNVAKTAKMAKTASTAYKVAKVAKLANVGRIAVTGGAALAGGPVGVALLVGSVVAPIAIEKIWKNREQIYNGGKALVDKSKLAAKDINAIVKGKNAQVGEVVPGAESLKIEGDNRSTLLETDDKGKVITNNFTPDQKLAFYQQEQGEPKMLVDEADVYPEEQAQPQNQAQTTPNQQVQSSPTIELDKNVQLPPPPIFDKDGNLLNKNGRVSQSASNTNQQEAIGETGAAAGKVSGMSVVTGSLQQLRQNNPGNNAIAQQTNFLEQGVNDAKSAQQVGQNNLQAPGLKQSIQLNEAGSSIINLFNLEQPPGKRNQPLETQDYTISRRGNDYFLKNKEGNTLLQASNTAFGTKIKSSNLSVGQQEDLNYLKQDLRLGEGITGGFNPIQPQSAKQAPQAEAGNVGMPQANSLKTPQQTMNRAPGQRSAFSQYIQEDKVPVAAGNTKQRSSEMER